MRQDSWIASFLCRAAIAAAPLCLATHASLAQQPAPAYQIHRDLIRGRVTTDSGVVVIGAEVAVTMAPDRTTQF
ncbi:MAG TPA: hypothetical protein VL524_12800, partial [Gemmatimonadaceae bacterium]|nr:hypothetical protein [Gemmatimonadaceae bacterium]